MTSFVLRGGRVVTMNARREIITGDVLVRDSRIVAVGQVSDSEAEGARVIDARNSLIIPGLIQTHIHLCQTLLRNGADDLRLLDWLRCRVWPMEAAHSKDSLRASCDVGIAELIRGGTTTILDMGTVPHQDVVFEQLSHWGLRAFAGKAMMDTGEGVPDGLREDTGASLRESDALCQRWHGAEHGRIHYAYAPRFALSCSHDLLLEVGRRAQEQGAYVHTHASEQQEECALVEQTRGDSNIAYLRKTNIYGPRTVLAHCVWATEREQQLMSSDKTRVSHCPSSNLKLGSGVAPISKYLQQNISVSLGADGAPCNNRLDAFEELRLAALLQKPLAGTQAMPANVAFELATLGGAKALGIDGDVGSIEVGKKADIVAVSLRSPHFWPLDEPYSQLVYCAQSSDVSFVSIDGEIKIDGKTLVGVDLDELQMRAKREATQLLSRAKL
jgi:5-methylthioadenosine/S-adenosylhomocysteine deaminase